MSARSETEIRTLPPAAEALTLTEDYSRHRSHPMLTRANAYRRDVHEIMRTWHNEQHAGAYQMCTEQPCDAIGRL